MIDFQLASLITKIIIDLAWIGVIYHGISRFDKAERARHLAGERKERENIRRHNETMARLKAQIRGLDNQGEALKKQGQALETLIARTGGKGTA